jgi:hypothetical protein
MLNDAFDFRWWRWLDYYIMLDMMVNYLLQNKFAILIMYCYHLCIWFAIVHFLAKIKFETFENMDWRVVENVFVYNFFLKKVWV